MYQVKQRLRKRGPIYKKEVLPESNESPDSKLIINERLTTHFYKLLKNCRDMVKSGKLNKCYYSNCQIFIKLEPDDDFQPIRFQEQLDDIISNSTNSTNSQIKFVVLAIQFNIQNTFIIYTIH